MKTILAIDPGTHCGWAVGHAGRVLASGTWNLTPTRVEGAGMRWVKLRAQLGKVAAAYHVDLVAFEDVHRHLGTDAAHVYGGIVAVIQEWSEAVRVPYFGVAVQSIKRYATGKGNANKDAMLAAARGRWPEIEIVDDNQADALWLLVVAEGEYGEGAS